MEPVDGCRPTTGGTPSFVELCRKYPGTDKNTTHAYGPVYDRELGTARWTIRTVLEIGILNGDSLRVWRDFCPWASVVGVDIDPRTLYSEPRIATTRADQSDPMGLAGAVRGWEFDLVVDDGSHRPDHQLVSLAVLWPAVRPGGRYVIEDVHADGRQGELLDIVRRIVPDGEVTSADLRPATGRYDDYMIWIRRPV